MPTFASGLNANLLNCQLLTYLIPKRIESPWTSRLDVSYCIDQLSQILAIVKFTFCVWILVCFLQEPVSNRHLWFKMQAHEKRGRRRETGICSGDGCIHIPRYWHPPAIGVDLRVRQAFQRRRICAIRYLETLNTWSVIVLWSREEREQRCRDGRRNCSTIGTFPCALWSCCATLELQGSLLDRIPSFQTRSGGACAGALRCSLGWQLAAQAMRSVFFTVKQSEEMLSMQECFLLLHSMPKERMVVA